MRAVVFILLCTLAATSVAAQDDLWGGPQTRLERVLDEASANLTVAEMQTCTRPDMARSSAARAARFRRVEEQATVLLGRAPRLTLMNSSCESYEKPRFLRSVTKFDRYLEHAAGMIRRRETN